MTQTRMRMLGGVLALVALAGGALLRAQATDPSALARQLRERYDLVALKDGVALVPHDKAAVRLIEVRDGGVALNGEAVTAKELRTRLSGDADLILKVTFLALAEQRALAGPPLTALPGSPGAAAASPASPPSPPPAPPTPPAGGEGGTAVRTQTRDGDLVRIGGSVTVSRDELIKGDIVVVGGSADVDGEVTGDVNVIGGSLRLGPSALIRQDVAIVGGTLSRDPSARVLGKLDEVGMGEMGPMGRRGARRQVERTASSGGGVAGTLLRGVLLALVALLVVTLGRRHVEALAARVAAEPVRTGLVGLLAEVGFAPLLVITIVVLVVSLIGIPLLLLLPFALVLIVVLALVGFTGVAAHVGGLVARRFGLTLGVHATVALGVAALVGLTLLGRLFGLAGGFLGGVLGGTLLVVGLLVEYVAWTMGLGAIILLFFQNRRPFGSRRAGTAASTAQAPDVAVAAAAGVAAPSLGGEDLPPFEHR